MIPLAEPGTPCSHHIAGLPDPRGRSRSLPTSEQRVFPQSCLKELPPTPPRTTRPSNCRSAWSGPPAPTARPMSPKTLPQTPGQETLYRCRKAGKVEKSSARDAHHQHYCVAAAFHSCTSWLYPRRHQRLCVQSGALRCHPLQSEYRHNAAMFLPDLQLP